jgi:hypothetical protein
MNLKFSIHFEQRLIERGISIDHVKKAIREPDEISSGFGGKIVVSKKIGDKTIKVVYSESSGKQYLIITAYYI